MPRKSGLCSFRLHERPEIIDRGHVGSGMVGINASHRPRRGYSLIELLVVVFIILLVMTLILCTLAKVWKVVEAFRK